MSKFNLKVEPPLGTDCVWLSRVHCTLNKFKTSASTDRHQVLSDVKNLTHLMLSSVTIHISQQRLSTAVEWKYTHSSKYSWHLH
jgi:hypothetical protein